MLTAASGELRRLVPLVVDQIVDAVSPVRIVVFGSVVRGDAEADSDLDVLVVLDHLARAQRARLMGEIRFAVSVPGPLDVFVTDVAEYEAGKDVNGSLFYWPEREGEVVYERSVA